MNERTSVLALIVNNAERATKFRAVFDDLLANHCRLPDGHVMIIKPFSSVGDFLRDQKENKNLHGTIIDASLVSDASELEKKAFSLLEDLMIPTLKASETLVLGDAAEKKILTGKWSQLMDQIQTFAPRGLRVFPRRICFVKIKYQRPGHRDGEQNQSFPAESRAVTYDLSLGGCFIVSMDKWDNIDQIEIYVGDFPTPIVCEIVWKLPWGASPWKMPGIGVEFKETSDQLKAYLINYLQGPGVAAD